MTEETQETSPEKPLSKGEQTRLAIIEAALALFREKGYHGTSMRQIATHADIALGGIYNHFASKDEIFAAVLDTYHPYRRMIPHLEAAEGDTVEELVKNTVRHVRESFEGNEDKILPIALIELIEFQGRHMATLIEKNVHIMLGFAQKFSERRGKLRNLPLPLVLRMLFVTYIGYLITEVILSRVPVFKNMGINWLDGLIDIYLHGILEPEQPNV
jgi:AcrR family transcriptional regulator